MILTKEQIIDKCLWFATTKLKDFIKIIGDDSYVFNETNFEKFLNENIIDDEYSKGYSDATEKAWMVIKENFNEKPLTEYLFKSIMQDKKGNNNYV